MVEPALYELESVRLVRGKTPVLEGLNLALPRHQWTCIVGPNGVGKSTLLRALAGLIPMEGRIRFEGDLRFQSDPAWRAQRLAWLGQVLDDDGDWTVAELALMGRWPHGSGWRVPSAEDHARVRAALMALSLGDLGHRRLATLSAGQRQRARLARLLCTGAHTLLLDEPVTHLDPPHQADWLAWAKGWVRSGHHLVTVLHELPLAIEADHLVVLHQGRCLDQGAPSDPAIRAAVEQAFEGRIRWVCHEGQWLSTWRHPPASPRG